MLFENAESAPGSDRDRCAWPIRGVLAFRPALLAGLLLLALAPVPRLHAATLLGVQNSRFTLNGQPAFLLGASYYGALGAPDAFVRQDLDDLQRFGFSWIRVWATWAAFTNDVSAVTPEGHPREPHLGRLRELVAECDRRGMVVDVTLSRGNGVTGPNRLGDLPSHRRAVETLATALRPWHNWYLDLGNERNIRDTRFVSIEDLRALRDAAKGVTPGLLVTASHAGGDLVREDVTKYLVDAGLDFLAPHRPRTADSAGRTAAHTREVLGWIRALGRSAPVHYQEPFRRGYGSWTPGATDFADDLRGAQEAGAAGWCWHNGDVRNLPGCEPRRSFDLRQRRLFDQIDSQERAFLERLPSFIPPNAGLTDVAPAPPPPASRQGAVKE